MVVRPHANSSCCHQQVSLRGERRNDRASCLRRIANMCTRNNITPFGSNQCGESRAITVANPSISSVVEQFVARGQQRNLRLAYKGEIRCATRKDDGEQPSINGCTRFSKETPYALILAASANVRTDFDATAHPYMRWKLRWDALQQYSAAIWIRDATPLHWDDCRATLWNRCPSSDALTLPITQWRGTECVTCSRISNTGELPRRAAGCSSRVGQRRHPAIHCRNIKRGVINNRAERLGERPPDQRGGRLIAYSDSLCRERRDLRQEAGKKIVNALKLRWNRLAH